MSTFFRGITEIIPSLFRGIFSERNSVPNPTWKSRNNFGESLETVSAVDLQSRVFLGYTVHILWGGVGGAVFVYLFHFRPYFTSEVSL
jgi:hypothetical protein